MVLDDDLGQLLDELEQDQYVPNADGYEHQLPDGVWVRVRLALTEGSDQVEWCIPDRQVDVPDDRNILKKFPGFIKKCALTAHREIILSQQARGMFLSYSTFYNVKVKLARDGNDADAGAEWGIAPWKLGQLSACLLMWDMLWGTQVHLYDEQQWTVQVSHIKRAYLFMDILDKIREGFRHGEVQDDAVLGAAVGADSQLPGCPVVQGTTTTEIVRRALCKGSPVPGSPGEYRSHSSRAFTMFTAKERQTVGKVPVQVLRDILVKCPEVLGKWEGGVDSLVFRLPEEPSDAVNVALKEFANTTVAAVRLALAAHGGGKRGGARRRSGANA